MEPCVWLIGRCGKKKTQQIRHIVRSRGLSMARCRNLGDLVRCLSREEFPTFLVCGPDIVNIGNLPGPHLPAFWTSEARTEEYLAAYAACEARLMAAAQRRLSRLSPPSSGSGKKEHRPRAES